MRLRQAEYMEYALVRELFNYDEVNGGLTRKVLTGGCKPKRPLTGTTKYRIHNVAGVKCKESRLVYLYHNEDMDQQYDIDHINNNTFDNRIENLRLVTHLENCFNRGYVRGFAYVARTNKWRSFIGLNRKYIHLGEYDCMLDARAAYLRAKKKYHVIEER